MSSPRVVSGSQLLSAVTEVVRAAVGSELEVLSPVAEVHVRIDVSAFAGAVAGVAAEVERRRRPEPLILRLDDDEQGNALLYLEWSGEPLGDGAFSDMDELRAMGASVEAGLDRVGGMAYVRFALAPAPPGEALDA